MKNILFIILLFATFGMEAQTEKNVEFYELTVDVKSNYQNELVCVESIKTKKKFWIKDIDLIESKEYDLIIKVFRGQTGRRVFGEVLKFDFSDRQKVLDFRKVKDSLNQPIKTNF